MSSKKDISSPRIATPEKRRICGGPSVSRDVFNWWENEQKRVAKVDHMSSCSIPDLMTRVAGGDLDLSAVGIEWYRKHPPRNGAGH